MSQVDVTPLVLLFLADHITTLEQFQVLIRLVQDEDRWWDAAAIAGELGLRERPARAALDHLAKHNLLDIRITGAVRYQFHPGTDQLRAAAEACADEFRRKPLQVLAAVSGSGQGQKSLRDFANAFRIRRDDDR
jgi:hypothetical protein